MQALLSRADRESKLLYFWSQIFENSSPCRLDFVLWGRSRAANLCLVADFHPASQQALYDSVQLALIVVVLQCEPAPLLQSNNENWQTVSSKLLLDFVRWREIAAPRPPFTGAAEQ